MVLIFPVILHGGDDPFPPKELLRSEGNRGK
jgi:hypothetical protein